MIRRIILAVAATSYLLAAPPAGSTETIKLATLAPEGSPWHNILRDLGENWKTASYGAVQLRIYPGGIAGDEPDMVRKMRIGQIDAAALTGFGLAQIAPEFEAFQLPMMLGSDDELEYVRSKVGGTLEGLLESRGFKLLTWGDAGWVYLFAQEPVVDPTDLKKLRLFVWSGNTAYAEHLRDAGFRPVPLAATEIHTALQSGLIQAFATTPIAALSFQWFGLAKNMTDLRWAPLTGAIIITLSKWRAIPAPTQEQLLRSARETGARLGADVRRFNQEAIEVMKAHGLRIVHVPPAIVSAWEKEVRLGYPKLIGPVVPAAIAKQVEYHRNQFRASRQGN